MTELRRLIRGGSPISVGLLTGWLRVSQADEPLEVFEMLIDAATDMAESFTGWSLGDHTYRKTWTAYKGGKVLLDYPTVTDVTEFEIVRGIGQVPVLDFRFTEDGEVQTKQSLGTRFFIEYETEGLRNEKINLAILKMCAYMYERRGDCDSAAALQNSGARELLAPFVRVFFR